VGAYTAPESLSGGNGAGRHLPKPHPSFALGAQGDRAPLENLKPVTVSSYCILLTNFKEPLIHLKGSVGNWLKTHLFSLAYGRTS